MPRVDRYDIIGITLLAFVAVVWILHFTLPAPPPDPIPGLPDGPPGLLPPGGPPGLLPPSGPPALQPPR